MRTVLRSNLAFVAMLVLVVALLIGSGALWVEGFMSGGKISASSAEPRGIYDGSAQDKYLELQP